MNNPTNFMIAVGCFGIGVLLAAHAPVTGILDLRESRDSLQHVVDSLQYRTDSLSYSLDQCAGCCSSRNQELVDWMTWKDSLVGDLYLRMSKQLEKEGRYERR